MRRSISAEELGRRGAFATEAELIWKPFTLAELIRSVAMALKKDGICGT